MNENDVIPDDSSNFPAIPTQLERQAMVQVGRPSKLTAETVDKLLESIEEGQTYKAACASVAISYQTLRNWIEQARRDIEDDILTEYVVFLDLLTRSEAMAERVAVRAWRAHFEKDYRAARDFLERRNRAQWGRVDTLDVKARVAVGVVLLPSVDDTPPANTLPHNEIEAIDVEVDVIDGDDDA